MPRSGLVLGIDEAGYGPRLGPLVIGAVALRGPAALAEQAAAPAWALLHDGVVEPGDDDGERLVAGDSKAIHKPSRGIGPLEEQVLALLHAVMGETPRSIGGLLDQLGASDAVGQPWTADRGLSLPRAADPARVAVRGERLRRAATAAGVVIESVRARCVHPPEFNAGVARFDNKARALFDWVGPLLADIWTMGDAVHRLAVLDKEGGRDRYIPLICETFRDARVLRRLAEGRHSSRYEVERGSVRCTMLFEPRGERHLPVALASMVAKYLRELAMETWNVFWTQTVPGLRRTAGYPQDATRFLAEIEGARARLGIAAETMVRCR